MAYLSGPNLASRGDSTASGDRSAANPAKAVREDLNIFSDLDIIRRDSTDSFINDFTAKPAEDSVTKFASLSSFSFTNQDDIAISNDGYIVYYGQSVDAKRGNDSIISNVNYSANGLGYYIDAYAYGISNEGTINMGAGNDYITASANASSSAGSYDYGFYGYGEGGGYAVGIGILNFDGTIDTGNGNDQITGTGNGTASGSGSGFFDNYGSGEGESYGEGRGYGVGIINEGGTINTGVGDDRITGTGNGSGAGYGYGSGYDYDYYGYAEGYAVGGGHGIWNDGTIDTGEGHDRITGTGNGTGTATAIGSQIDIYTNADGYGYGYGIWNEGTINTGDGNDDITGTGNGIGIGTGDSGIYGEIDGYPSGSAAGLGIGFGEGYGILNYGTINTGKGHDRITGTGNGRGAGYGYGNVYDGYGVGEGYGEGYGIWNDGLIDTGTGNDYITGSGYSSAEAYADGYYWDYNWEYEYYGIWNNNTINTGEGQDTVNGLQGGFGGNGTTNLGGDNDTLIGFGAGNFYGGSQSDKILFGYDGEYTINGSTIAYDGITMNIFEFESIGGVNGGIFALQNGVLTIAGGVATSLV